MKRTARRLLVPLTLLALVAAACGSDSNDSGGTTAAPATEAAATGMGIAIGRAPLISPDLAAGRLVMADTKVIDIETGYWLVGPDGQETRPAIRSFRRWVIEEAKEYCAQNGLR